MLVCADLRLIMFRKYLLLFSPSSYHFALALKAKLLEYDRLYGSSSFSRLVIDSLISFSLPEFNVLSKSRFSRYIFKTCIWLFKLSISNLSMLTTFFLSSANILLSDILQNSRIICGSQFVGIWFIASSSFFEIFSFTSGLSRIEASTLGRPGPRFVISINSNSVWTIAWSESSNVQSMEELLILTKSHLDEKIMSSLEPHLSLTHVKPPVGLNARNVSTKFNTLLFSIINLLAFASLFVFCLFTPSMSSRTTLKSPKTFKTASGKFVICSAIFS